jgi:predicted MPP superfamily phosphohydrolase
MRRTFGFVLFLAIFVAIIGLANWVVLAAVMTVTDASAAVAWMLGLAQAVLSASFIAATMLGSRYYNWFTRWYYRVSATWLGMLFYLFWAAVTYGLIVAIVGLPEQWVGAALLMWAVGAGMYGFIHARAIVVKEVRVTLPNLPEVWRGRRVIWTSDVHLGQLHGPRFARRVVKLINSVPHDMVCIGGDLYDGTGAPDIEELAQPWGTCKAPLGVYFITGNHEEYGDRERFTTAIRAAGIRTLVDDAVTIDGLQFVGVDYQNNADKERFAATLAKLVDHTVPTILLKHEPKDLDIARDAEVQLQVSGHTHRAQLWPLEYVARLAYKGFAYGLKNLDSLQVYVSSGTGTWGPPMRVGTTGEIVVFVFE